MMAMHWMGLMLLLAIQSSSGIGSRRYFRFVRQGSVHAVVNQKHIGYLVALLAYGVIAFPSWLGIEHHLLIYGSEPGWSYSDIRGFGPYLEPMEPIPLLSRMALTSRIWICCQPSAISGIAS
jgi:hypothetical protein